MQADGDNFRIDCRGLRANGGTDQWMVENWDDDYVYIDVAYAHNMHKPWKFTEIDGQPGVYYITIVGGTDDGRRLEIDSRNNGVPDLNNRAGVVPYTRSTGPTSYGGNMVEHNNEWMIVTPADYEASLAGYTDFTSKVGLAQADWSGASEFGNAVHVVTADGRDTGIPAFYGSSAVGTKMSQTVTGLDNGIYEVKVFAHSHNERADHGTAAPGSAVNGYTETAYVFAESGDSHVQTWINARGRDPLGWTKAEFLAPYTLTGVTVKNGQITIGLGLAKENTTQWQAIQIYSLVKTGDLPLTEKIEAYESALTNASTTAADTDLPAGFRSALQNVIDANSGDNKPSYTNADELDVATAALNNAIVEAETSRAPFARYNAVKTDVLALDDDATAFIGDAKVDVSAADAAVNAANTIDGINKAIPLLRSAAFNFINNVNVVPGKSFELTKILIENYDLEEGISGWVVEGDGTWRNMLSDGGVGYGAEFYHGTRNIYQSFTDLPQGRYQASVQATWRDAQSTALYLTTAKGTENTQIAQLVPNNNPGEQLLAMHNDPEFARITVDNSVTDGTLTIGLKEKVYGGDCWTLFDNFRLFYTGLDYSSEEATLAAALNTADEFAETQNIPASVKTSLHALSTSYNVTDIEASGTYTQVIAAFAEAVTAINAAVTEAQAYVAPYAAFIQTKDAVEVILAQTDAYTPDTGKETALRAAAATAQTKADAAGDVATVDEAATDVRSAIAAFVKATNIAGKYFDLTSLIENPGFEEGRNTGWNYSYDHAGAFNWMTRDAFHCVEFFNCTYDLNQTLTSMPAGTYRVAVNGHYRPNNEYAPAEHLQENVDGYLYVTGGTPIQLQVLRNNETSISAIHALMDGGEYANEAFALVDGADVVDVTFGVKCDIQRRQYSWTLIDDFRLYYTIEDNELFLAPYNEALAAAKAIDTTQPMNKVEKEALVDAIAADATLDKSNIASLQDATIVLTQVTVTAQTSINAYVEANSALARIATEMSATNVVTPEAVATFNAYTDAYNAGSLTDDEASALMRRTFRDGVGYGNNNTFDEYLLSAWKEGDTEMSNYDGTLYVNTWSTEADVEGFAYPFYEVADGYNTSTIAHTFTATVSGLEPGAYKVELWARTRIRVAGVDADTNYPEGITFTLNDGTPVTLKGELTGRFRASHYNIYGNVDADGVLALTLNIPASEQGTWLSFRDVKYSKIEVPSVTIDEDIAYTPVAGVADITLRRTFNTSVWNTLTLPFRVDDIPATFGSDAKVALYTGSTTDGEYTTLNFTQIDYIPANQPVLISGVENKGTYTFAFAEIEKGEPVIDDATLQFIGSYTTKTLDPTTTYFVGSDNKLYKTGTNGTITLKGTRAYFAEVASGVKSVRMHFDGEATAITELTEKTEAAEGAIYNVNGQRISTLQKGINIVNGKKLLVK